MPTAVAATTTAPLGATALLPYLHRGELHHQKLLLEIKNPELYPGIEKQTLKSLSNEGLAWPLGCVPPSGG